MAKKKVRYPGIMRIGQNSYRIRVTAVDPKTGKRKEADRIVACKRVQDAAAIRLEMKREIELGGESAREQTKLKDYVRSWLTGKLSTVKPSTASRYAEVLDLHIIPRFGDFYVDKVTRQDVITWVAWMVKQGKAGSTVAHHYAVLRSVMREAEAAGDIARNPCHMVSVPRRTKNYSDEDPNLLAPEELRELLKYFREDEPQWYPLVLTLALTGARWGEATALRWSDVDDDAGVIRIGRAQWRGQVGTTKTNKVRTVPLVPEIADVLRAHRVRLVKEQHAGLATDLVFPSGVGKILQPSVLRKPLLRALDAIGCEVKLTVHGLRRTFNNLARQVSAHEVTKAMTGHVTDSMLIHYSHVNVAEKTQAVGRVLHLVQTAGIPTKCGDPRGEKPKVVPDKNEKPQQFPVPPE